VKNFAQSVFEQPGREYAAAFAWVWNTTITEEGIKSRLEDMRRAGIRGVYVLPEPREFRPVTMDTDMQPGYMTDDYLKRMRYFCQTAREMGFTVWLYDEAGWPSGSVCTQIIQRRPDLRRQTITCIPVKLQKGMHYAPPLEHENFLACFVKDRSGNYRRITEPIVFDGESEVIEYRCMATYMTYIHNEDYNTDILHPDTGKLFIELTHEKYKRALGDLFGTFIPYIFDDEPGVDAHAWTPGLEMQFREAYGYDILDYLPVIKAQIPPVTPAQRQALSDWRQLVCRLAMQHFFLPIRDWCRKNGLLSIGHLDGDHDAAVLSQKMPCYAMPLEVLRCYDVPGVDVIWRHLFPKGAGTPSFQDAVPFFPRFASSAAAQIGGGLALTESMAVYGDGATPSLIRYVFGAEAVRGINVFNVNSISYAKCPIRPGFSADRPGYEHLAAVNAYLARLSYLAQTGTIDCETAIYLPCLDLSRDGNADAFHELGIALERQHVYFDVIDDAFVRDCVIKDGALTMGLAAYKHVWIPDGATMPEDVQEKLRGFITNHVQPVAKCSNENIRLCRRKMPDGSALYLAFNESKDPQHAAFSFAEQMPCYRLFIEDGRIEHCNPFDMRLEMGETAALLFTEKNITAAKSRCITAHVPISGPFTLKKTKEFSITRNGVLLEDVAEPECNTALGSWRDCFGETFSGEAIYTTTLKLDRDVFADGEFVLDLGCVEYTADVTVNGVHAGIAAFWPHTVSIDRSLLREENTIEIKVANTACNRTVTADVYSYFHQRTIGPYHQKECVFERETLGGGLYGPVTLRKLQEI